MKCNHGYQFILCTCRSASSPAHWPFEEMLVRGEAGIRVADVENLENLVGRILGVFQSVMATQLQKRWSEVALRWATSCSSRLYASKSFQVCPSVCLSVHVCLSVYLLVCICICYLYCCCYGSYLYCCCYGRSVEHCTFHYQ